MRDLFTDNPGRDRIDVEADHIATDPVSFDQRRAASDKRIRHDATREIIGAEKSVGNGFF
ncbi:hypothetical protein D3C83_79330 [compost metagenome]